MKFALSLSTSAAVATVIVRATTAPQMTARISHLVSMPPGEATTPGKVTPAIGWSADKKKGATEVAPVSGGSFSHVCQDRGDAECQPDQSRQHHTHSDASGKFVGVGGTSREFQGIQGHRETQRHVPTLVRCPTRQVQIRCLNYAGAVAPFRMLCLPSVERYQTTARPQSPQS
jgi:hypothetical protein